MKRLVLVGAGHAHAQVLLELWRRGIAGRDGDGDGDGDLEIVLVSPHPLAPYSGMVPGWLAGHYRWEECCIDFRRLCERANARLVTDSVVAVEPDRAQIVLQSGRRLGYDWLSINIGSTLHAPPGHGIPVLPMRPLADLHARWHALLDRVRGLEDGAAYRVLMVGGGAAGVESVLAAHERLTRLAPRVRFRFLLATHGDELVPGLAPDAARALRTHLERRGIAVHYGFAAERIAPDGVLDASGRAIAADAVLWATGAQACDWPRASGLATDAHGFILVDRSLRAVGHPRIFAVGDCATWEPPLPKAGVFSVRMGPVLAHNLIGAIDGSPPVAFAPQRRWLALIGTGGEHAVASWGALGWQGDWVWRWKRRIDRRFVDRYHRA